MNHFFLIKDKMEEQTQVGLIIIAIILFIILFLGFFILMAEKETDKQEGVCKKICNRKGADFLELKYPDACECIDKYGDILVVPR